MVRLQLFLEYEPTAEKRGHDRSRRNDGEKNRCVFKSCQHEREEADEAVCNAGDKAEALSLRG